jgi:nucleotide-binding universal stress UspA family protein
MYKHLLIATDGSELAQRAVEQGLALAKALSAKATIVTVTGPWPAIAPGEVAIAYPIEAYEKDAAAHARGVLSAVEAAAKQASIACETLHVKDQHAAEGIMQAAKERGCDLIVMASHGRRGLTQFLLGSQANEVVARSTLPVLICR